MIFAYADPPYFKQGKRLYAEHHPDAAIWDNKETHLELLEKLKTNYPDGWALSCNPADLAWLLPAAGSARVCVWAKTFHQIRPLCSVQYAWEPVILSGGRQIKNRKPMTRDWLAAARSMRKGLPGAKPDAFNDWLLDLLGYETGDELHDLFPGTNGLAAAVERRQP
jgi:hypothetical protein